MCMLQMKVGPTRKEPRVPARLTRHSATLCQRWCLQTCPQVSPDFLLRVQILIGDWNAFRMLDCLVEANHLLKQVVELNYSLFYYNNNNNNNIYAQNNIEVDTERKESMRRTEEKLDGRYKEGHERKKPK